MFWKRNKNRTKINEEELLKTLTVKAVEESGENFFNPIAVSRANISALSSKSDVEFVLRRANYLFFTLPEYFQNILHFTGIKGSWIRWFFIISFIIGAFSNYLGNSKVIQVIYNPVTILIAWNILIYLILVLKNFVRISLPKFKIKTPEPDNNVSFNDEIDTKQKAKKPGFLVNFIFHRFLKATVNIRSAIESKKEKTVFIKKVLPLFWKDYQSIAGNSLVYKFKSLLNINSIGLVLGALTGIYIRGLFYKYDVTWESTFINDPNTIKFLLNLIYGPANLILHGQFFTIEQIELLLNGPGVSAAPWIHIMFLTTLLYVIIPRSFLAVYYAVKAKYELKNIDINDPYFSTYVIKTRETLIEEVKQEIENIIRKKIERTAKSIADFVTQDYFDKIIMPILLNYREKGGKIKDLEKQLFESQQDFEPILINYLSQVQEDFRESVLSQINLYLGRNFEIDIETGSNYKPKSNDLDRNISGKLASEISDTMGGTFVTAMAVTAGTLTGGLGKSLGTAILVSLLGVSGPIGLLIGAVATAATLGGFYKFKKEQIKDMIKEIPLPAPVVAMTLTNSKLKKAREETFRHTENEIKNILESKVDEVAERILKEITY